jgi:hypothetical protein
LHNEFAYYGWDTNKGYGTAEHRNGIKERGICKYHRKSFDLYTSTGYSEDLIDPEYITPKTPPYPGEALPMIP